MPVVNRVSYGRTMRDLNTSLEKMTSSLTAWKDRLFNKPLNQNKMTAVEWLVGEIKSGLGITTVMVELAKEMEKEQIMDAFIFSKDPFGVSIGNSHTIKKAEDYYNETFKSE